MYYIKERIKMLSSGKNINDELREEKDNLNEPVDVMLSAQTQQAISDAYGGGVDLVKGGLTPAEVNNMEQQNEIGQRSITFRPDTLRYTATPSVSLNTKYYDNLPQHIAVSIASSEVSDMGDLEYRQHMLRRRIINNRREQAIKPARGVSSTDFSDLEEMEYRQRIFDKRAETSRALVPYDADPQVAEYALDFMNPVEEKTADQILKARMSETYDRVATRQEKQRIKERNARAYRKKKAKEEQEKYDPQKPLTAEEKKQMRDIKKKSKKENYQSPRNRLYNRIQGFEEPVRIGDEALPVGRVNIRRRQPTSSTDELTQLPVGVGRFPRAYQGTPNYDPTSSDTQYSTMSYQTADDTFINTRPSPQQVDDYEGKYEPVDRMEQIQQDNVNRREVYEALDMLGALGTDLENTYGGRVAYFTSVKDLLEAGGAPKDIVNRSLTDLYGVVPLDNLEGGNDSSGVVSVLDEQKLINDMGDIDPFKREQILIGARKVINGEMLGSRTDNPMDYPDQGGAPVSSSTGTMTDGDYHYNGRLHDPENDAYNYNRYYGGRPNEDGYGNKVSKAIHDLYNLSPHIAQMLTDKDTKPLYIKRMPIKSIYPPRPKNTNLKIVQQSIANNQEDASLLNVFFS
jgi:hypothetical protein